MSAIGPKQSRPLIKLKWTNNKKEQILLSRNVLITISKSCSPNLRKKRIINHINIDENLVLILYDSLPSTPIKRRVQGERYNIEPVNLLLKFNSVQDHP